MSQGNPRPGEKYLHFKNKMYQVIAIGKHSETDEKMVVYQALYGEYGVCIRPYDMFISEVDHEKYPQVTQKYRFQCMGYDGKMPEAVMAAGESDHNQPEVSEGAETGYSQSEVLRDAEPGYSQSEALGDVEIGHNQPVRTENMEPEEGQANPWLMKFLDAESFEEKYKIVSAMYAEINDKLIDDLAVCLDVVIPEGKLQDRYLQLKQCIRTRQKYEGRRI